MSKKLGHLLVVVIISLIFVTSSTSKAFAISDDVTQLQISNLYVASGEDYKVVENGLQNGEPVYIDYGTTFSTVPTSLEGATYIKTARHDRRSNDAAFLTFDVNQDVAVYVGHDDSIGTKPSWLTSFTDTGDDIVTTDSILSIYESNYLAGTITLGGNDGNTGSSMYTVIVVGQGTGDEDLTSTATEDEDLTSTTTGDEDLTSTATGGGTKGHRTSTATEDEDLKLFQSLDGNPVNMLSAEDLVLEQMIVNVNFDVLKKDIGNRYADSISIDLFGQSLQVDKRRVDERSPSAYTWVGKVQGNQFSKVILTVGNNAMFGRIEYLDNVYKIEPIGDGTSHRIINLDSMTTLPCGNDSLLNSLGVSSNALSSNMDPVSEEETFFESVVDIMILYTAQMAIDFPDDNIKLHAHHIVDLANNAFIDSEINMRINIVAILQVPYTEFGSSRYALEELTADPNVASLRNHYGADLVTLLRSYKSYYSDCGSGYVMQDVDISFHQGGYSVVHVGFVDGWGCGDYSLAHEVGHNMGNQHDRDHADNEGAYSYSYGHDVSGVFGTIMSYDNQSDDGLNIRIGHFSNPDVDHNEIPTGVHDSADNARSMRKAKETVSRFRLPTINRGSISDTSLITSDDVTQQLHFSDMCGWIPEISGVRLTFIEAINPDTFTLEDIVLSPVSVRQIYDEDYTFNLALTDVKVVPGSGDRQFDINFTPLPQDLVSITGTVSVSLTIGPDIEDLNGNQFDLDLDGTYGETGDDMHVVSFGYDKGFDLSVDCYGDRLIDASLRDFLKLEAEIMAALRDITVIDPSIITTDIITTDIITTDIITTDITTTDYTINFQSSFLGY